MDSGPCFAKVPFERYFVEAKEEYTWQEIYLVIVQNSNRSIAHRQTLGAETIPARVVVSRMITYQRH